MRQRVPEERENAITLDVNGCGGLTLMNGTISGYLRAIVLSGRCRGKEFETLKHIALHLVVVHGTNSIGRAWL